MTDTTVGSNRLSILLADPEDKWLQAVASIETEEALEAIRVPIGPAGGWLAQAYQTKKAIIWNGQGPTPEELRLKGLSVSGLRHPAAGRSESNIRGSGGSWKGNRPFDPAAVEPLQVLAQQAAVASEHSRLYAAAQPA